MKSYDDEEIENLDSMIYVRVSEKDALDLKKIARKSWLPVSTWVRAVVLRELERLKKKR